MWCPNCSADIATELSPDERRLNCARCGQELQAAAAALLAGPRPDETPHDVLARWSAEDIFSLESRLLVDGLPAHAPPAAATNLFETPVEPSRPSSPTSQPSTPGPARAHLQRRPEAAQIPTQRWVGVVGQFAAYAGVLLLTAGTVAVVAGHFGQTPRAAVNGWLLAAVGQMLLLLGVTTLISSGIEQSRQEMHQRLSRIERRLRRIRHTRQQNPSGHSSMRDAA